MGEYANDVLVSTDWLAENIDNPDVRIVEVDEDTEAYERGHIRKRISEDPVVTLDRGGRVAVERSADRVREPQEVDRLGVHDTVAISEVMHGRWVRLWVRGSGSL